MRIISGKAKNRRLASFKGAEIRPVLDQVKESIFNILFDVTDLSVLDIFAGTGSIGLEAISRGAANVTFVENNKKALKIIKENTKRCGFEGECKMLPLHVDAAIKRLAGEKFDLIFIDPPYLKDFVRRTIQKVYEARLLEKGCIIICEHHPKELIDNLPESLELYDQRKYGQTLISFIKEGAKR